MEKDNLKKLVEIRKYIIEEYNSLDGKGSPGTSLVRQVDVADTYSTVIKMIDRLISPFVNFEKQE